MLQTVLVTILVALLGACSGGEDQPEEPVSGPLEALTPYIDTEEASRLVSGSAEPGADGHRLPAMRQDLTARGEDSPVARILSARERLASELDARSRTGAGTEAAAALDRAALILLGLSPADRAPYEREVERALAALDRAGRDDEAAGDIACELSQTIAEATLEEQRAALTKTRRLGDRSAEDLRRAAEAIDAAQDLTRDCTALSTLEFPDIGDLQLESFSVDRFENNLKSFMTGNAIGWTYSIWLNGKPAREAGFGFSRTAADPPQTSQGPDRPMNTASTGKVLTTIAALKLFETTPNVSLTWSISSFLPEDWPQGPGIPTKTFKDLLSYCSGFLGKAVASRDSWDDLKYVISQPASSRCEYENANFGMFRVLIPEINGFDFASAPEFPPLLTKPLWAGILYADYVRDAILVPAGVSAGLCQDNSDYPTLEYLTTAPGGAGSTRGVELLFCGGGGWYLSANDWNRILSMVQRTDFLSEASRLELYGTPLGFASDLGEVDRPSPAIVHWKSGGYMDPGGAVSTCILQASNGVTATLLVNSNIAGAGICGDMRQAYYDAWLPIAKVP